MFLLSPEEEKQTRRADHTKSCGAEPGAGFDSRSGAGGAVLPGCPAQWRGFERAEQECGKASLARQNEAADEPALKAPIWLHASNLQTCGKNIGSESRKWHFEERDGRKEVVS